MLMLVSCRYERKAFKVVPFFRDNYIGKIHVSVLELVIPKLMPRRFAVKRVNAILNIVSQDSSIFFCPTLELRNSGLLTTHLRKPDLRRIVKSKAGELLLLSRGKKNSVLICSNCFDSDVSRAVSVLLKRYRYFTLDVPVDCFERIRTILAPEGITPRLFSGYVEQDGVLLFEKRDIYFPEGVTVLNTSGEGRSDLRQFSLYYPSYMRSDLSEQYPMDEIIAYALQMGIITPEDIVVSQGKFS